MSKGRVRVRALLVVAMAAQLLSACSGGVTANSIQAMDPKRVHSKASVGDLVLCLKQRLGDDATVIAYPEPGKVDIRVGRADADEYKFIHLVSLRRATEGVEGTDVEIRSSGEWHPLLSASRVSGMVEDCTPGRAH